MDFNPLADRVRPTDFDDFVGQMHLVGKDGVIRKLAESDNLISMILWGPPGCGKTTLARILAIKTQGHFIHFSAVTTGLDDLRKVIREAGERKIAYQQKTIVFVDEIHRFNKLQQDAFLPPVENGTIILIGATTENPSFEVNSPLLSRCRVFVLNPLEKVDLYKIISRTEQNTKLSIRKNAKDLLVDMANGDARTLLNLIELAANLAKDNTIDDKIVKIAAQKQWLQYDQGGDEHYNTISAFIKSMRASNPDAALYYLARMLQAGEDPLFIARRMIVFASEDIGLAQPTAIVVANTVFDACHKIGMPECQENLAHGVVYLACAKKDRSAYDAYMAALEDVEKYGNLPIPLQLRNAPTKLMKELGYGKDYQKYTTESLLPEKIKTHRYSKVISDK